MILKNTYSARFFLPLLFVSGLSAAPRLNLVPIVSCRFGPHRNQRTHIHPGHIQYWQRHA